MAGGMIRDALRAIHSHSRVGVSDISFRTYHKSFNFSSQVYPKQNTLAVVTNSL